MSGRSRLRTAHRAATTLVLLAPLLSVLALDVARRGARLAALHGLDRLTYAGAIVESGLVWAALLHAAARRRGAARHVFGVLFVLLFTLTVGGQRYFHDQFRAYLNVDVSLFATNMMDSVWNQLLADIANYARAVSVPLVVGVCILLAARRVIRPRFRDAFVTARLAPLLVVAAFFVPTQHRHVQAALPDVLYLEAVGGVIRTQLGFTDMSKHLSPHARTSLPVSLRIPTTEGRRPNVVLVILESVRADSVCDEPGPSCLSTPYTSALFPSRHPLKQLRAMDSATAISLAVLWSGLGPEESRERFHTWPLLFDYAKARGYDTAFYTSQNMLFGNARLWVQNLGVSHMVTATEIDPEADLDMGASEHYLAEYVTRHVAELREPYLAVIQLSNMHYPYLVDRAGEMPFTPWTTSKASEENDAYLNYYRNGVHQQDEKVANVLRAVKSAPSGERTVVFYTSDHGEAFREHGQMGHTFTVLDEEIHVPGWIDAPPGTITESEREHLRAAKDVRAFHVDVVPTVLDLIGVWRDPGIAEYRARLRGRSLLDAPDDARAVPLTNCATLWSCAYENWGYMRGPLKIEARDWNDPWHCFDVDRDPGELHDLGVAGCADLKSLAVQAFDHLPGRTH